MSEWEWLGKGEGGIGNIYLCKSCGVFSYKTGECQNCDMPEPEYNEGYE